MSSKNCPKCREEVKGDAVKCKHCGEDMRNWFLRHKIITGLLVLVFIGIIGSAMDGNISNNSEYVQKVINTQKTVDDAVKKQETNEVVTKANCDSIKSGMDGDQVKGILGEPKSTSESEIEGFGKTEYWHYQEGFSMKSCAVFLTNGKVSSKTWTEL